MHVSQAGHSITTNLFHVQTFLDMQIASPGDQKVFPLYYIIQLPLYPVFVIWSENYHKCGTLTDLVLLELRFDVKYFSSILHLV